MAKREESAPTVGDEAPDFELPVLDRKGATMRLSELRGKPVALIFGSYT
ncbi:MAG: redoxin domain-containing protein [Chloroflexi bacterium]|nr:redoxin domain-containing protein [Chloroflexota bacterium]